MENTEQHEAAKKATEQQEAAKKAAEQELDKLRKKRARYTNRYYVPSYSLVTNNLELGLKRILIKSIRYVGMFENI